MRGEESEITGTEALERGSSGWGLASELYLASGTLEVRCVSLGGETINLYGGAYRLQFTPPQGSDPPTLAAQSALV